MSLKSMTGFARADGADETASWYWELRSVNGRGLDLRLRMPSGFEAIEPEIRSTAQKSLSRGNVQANLTVKREAAEVQVRLNEDVLRDILSAAEIVQRHADVAPPSVDGLLALRGVLEISEAVDDPATVTARMQAILEDFRRALHGLVESRVLEGQRLSTILEGQIGEIERLVAIAAKSPARTPDAIKQRLRQQVESLRQTDAAVDEQRLHQEAVLLAARVDIEEEIQRLGSHIAAARDLLARNEPVGRAFDFLAQEFNREANTLCSKANHPDITRAGLEMKVTIDQLKEQVANVE